MASTKWNVGWGCVSNCNMNCRFCYSKKRRFETTDLNYNEWVKFIDENHEYINSINYGTGENTTSKDWFRLVAYIRKNYPFIRQALTTNGYLSVAVEDEECMQAFVNGIDEVDVSLDFFEETRHADFRGQPQAYKWALDTLKLCQEYRKKTTIVFIGSKQNLNVENIDGLFAIAKKYDAILRMNVYRPTDGINENSKKFIVDYSDIVCILKHISEKYTILSLGDTLFSPILAGTPRKDPSGCNSIRILSDGSITPSTYLITQDFTVANITDKNILKKLSTDGRMSEIIRTEIPQACKSCVYIDSCCGGVYDRRYLWGGSLKEKDPYCQGPYTELLPATVVVHDENFSSVHDGYLPTIFFKP